MASTSKSLALQRIKEQIAALNFATDALTVLLDAHQFDPVLADLRLRQLSAWRTDLRDTRMTIIATGAVADPPSAAEIEQLRQRVAALYNWNRASDAIDTLIGEAIAIAAA
ncbi:hypothetical protein [Sphingomonas sp. SAFR-052]|uniref:hypothetical protein n=1 Tax=Sphingomonas sp. SAFR-052 TaxID=3436867 RepID=UPI003F7F67CA